MRPLPHDLIKAVARAAGRDPIRKGAPRGEFLIRCPWSENHRNGDEHPSCRLNPEKNTFYCDPCGKGGGAKDLAEAFGGDLGALLRGPRRSRRHLSAAKKAQPHFSPSGPISDSTATHLAERLGKNYPMKVWREFGVQEGLVGNESAIAFSLPSSGFKTCLYKRPDRRTKKPYSWTFCDGGAADLIVVGDGDQVLLCAGEWDALAALAAGVACVATATTGEGSWQDEWSEKLRGRDVIVVYDVDPAGRRGSARVVRALAGVAARVWDLRLPLSGDPEKDGKDLSDYLAVHGREAFHAILRAVQESPPAEVRAGGDGQSAGFAGSIEGEKSLAGAIDFILCQPLPVRLKRREAAKLVIEGLRQRGNLIQVPGGRQFWFEKERRRLHDLDAFSFRTIFTQHFGVNPAEPEFRHIFEAVKAETLARGRRASVYRFSYYDADSRLLYVAAGEGRVVRLDGTQIVWIDNGADGVLFEESEGPQTIPDDAINTAAVADPLAGCLLDRVNFIRGAGVILGANLQMLLLRIWLLAIFFPELLPSKILLLLYGEKGSGKTTTLRVILKLLLGPHANVTPLAKEDGFNAAVSQEYLLVLDNVDSSCRWIEDRLATVATGQTIRFRKLYTTNEVVSFPTRCCIALTARTPRFRRDDVVDRLLILRVARLETFSREAEWYAEIEQRRSELWAQLLRDLNKVVGRLREQATASPNTIRMADWGFLALVIGEALGEGEAIRSALEASELDKAHFMLEADELYDILHAVAHDEPNREWKAGELFAELSRRAQSAGVELTVKSPKSLGRILRRLEPALKLMIRFEIRQDLHDGQAVYVLGPLQGGTDVT